MKVWADWLNENVSPRIFVRLVDGLAGRIDNSVEPFINRHLPPAVASVVKGTVVDLGGGSVHLLASTLFGGGLVDLEVGLLTDPITLMKRVKDNFVTDFKDDPVRVVTSLVVPIVIAKAALATRTARLAEATRAAQTVVVNPVEWTAERALATRISTPYGNRVLRLDVWGEGEVDANGSLLAWTGWLEPD